MLCEEKVQSDSKEPIHFRSYETRVAIASLGNRSSTTGRVSSFNLQKSIRIYKKRTWRFLRYLDFQMHGRPLAELLLDMLVTPGPNKPRMVPPAMCPGFEFQNLSSPKPGHTTGGSGRGGARRGGGAGRGRAAQDADGTARPGDNCPVQPPKASYKHVLSVCSEERTSEIPCKPMGEQSPRLTNGLSAG